MMMCCIGRCEGTGGLWWGEDVGCCGKDWRESDSVVGLSG